MLKTPSQLILESSTTPTKYGCLMVGIQYDMDKITELISPLDLCEEEGGIEDEPHVTLLYGFHETTDPEMVIKLIQQKANFNNLKTVALDRVSLFKQEAYEVLKFDIKEAEFYKLNKMVCKNFQYTNKYPHYHAHCTVAYLKPGTGDKYVKQLSQMKMVGKPTELVYSDKDKNKTRVSI